MNELRPLRTASPQAVSRLLLESALDDHSAPGAAERALKALNLGAVAAAAVVGVQAATSSSVSGHFAGGMVIKWLGLGLVVGIGTVLSAEQVMHAVPESKTAPTVAALKTANPVAPHANRALEETATPAGSEITPPAARAARPLAGRLLPEANRALPAPDVSQASAEPLQELHAVRRALADHAPERALALLDSFVTRHPASSLLEEAAVLRFDALLAAGRSEARAEGREFLRRYPRSAYAERVRSKLSNVP